MSFAATRTVTDPAWFYSSLAQATAALVGFVGGFYIYRLQGYISDWTTAARELTSQQVRWLAAHRDVRREQTVHAADAGDGLRSRTEAERIEDNLWADLRRHLDAQDSTVFPAELGWLGLGLAALFVVGCVIPLMWLGEPSNIEQFGFVLPVTLLVVAIGAYMHHRARSDFVAWKAVPRRPEVEAELAREDEPASRAGG